MKSFFFLLFLASFHFSLAQKDVHQVAISDLPKDIQEVNGISTAVRWTDSLGDNILITTKKIITNIPHESTLDEYERKLNTFTRNTAAPSDRSTMPTFAYHFLVVKDSAILTWKVVGLTQLCEGEDVNHTKQWFVVTDLNRDSRGEVWLIYQSMCEGDETPTVHMKVVMCEGDARYTMSGEAGTEAPAENFFDSNFKKLPQGFKDYARDLWKKFVAVN